MTDDLPVTLFTLHMLFMDGNIEDFDYGKQAAWHNLKRAEEERRKRLFPTSS